MKPNIINLISLMIVTLTMVVTIPAFGQWEVGFSSDQSYDENPFLYRDAQPGWVSSYSGNIRYNLNALSFGYTGNFHQFAAVSERNFYWHQLAITREGENSFWGVSANQRINRSEYDAYDYFTAHAFYQHQIRWHTVYSTLNISLSGVNYSQLGELNHWLFSTSLYLNRSFPTGTALLGNVGYQFKKYTREEILEVSNEPANTGGWGHGGRGAAPQYLVLDAPSVSQLSYWLRATQSITPTTGLAGQFQQQFSLTGSNRYLSGLSYSQTESEIFDDPLGYDGYSLRLMLTQLLPHRIKVRGGFIYQLKDYTAQGTYLDAETFSADILRRDIFRNGWLYIEKPLFFPGKSGSGMNIYLQYQWLRNGSNSYWYDYQGQSIALGIEMSF
ncbi:MAG: hypothetical protein Kow0042_01540 [Calditrichia bacterium]